MKIVEREYIHLLKRGVLEFIFDRNTKDPGHEIEAVKRYGNHHFNKELNTFYLKMPRQSGNTTLAIELGETLHNPCFVFSKDLYAKEFQYKNRINNVFSQGVNLYELKKFDYIIVNDYSSFERSFIDRMWSELSPQMFLFIG